MILRRIEAIAVLGAAMLMLSACGPAVKAVAKAAGSSDDLARAAKAGDAIPPPAAAQAEAEAGAGAAGGAKGNGRKAAEEIGTQGAEQYIERVVSGNEQN